MLVEDYLHAVNQTYEIKLRKQGYTTITTDQVLFQGKKGVVDNLRAIWDEHQDDDWEKFDKEEICRYICEKIALNQADFLSDETKNRLRGLYRLIAERIRQFQNTVNEI
jgi:hypothetical protein